MVLVTTVSWSILLALTFEFSRKFRAYDYRTFFKNLLGPFWPVFEIIYTIYLLIVLGVIGSAAGTLLKNNLGLPYILGVIIMLAAVGFLTFKGSKIIENFLSLWSIVLYTTFAVLLVVIFTKFTPQSVKTLPILPSTETGLAVQCYTPFTIWLLSLPFSSV